MANTIVQIDVPETLLPALALLTPAEAGLVAANPLGYTVLAGAESWQFTITVPEACVGFYRLEVRDSGGVTVAIGWVWIEADDTSTYVAEGSLARLVTQRELEAVIKSGEERRISRAGKADIVYVETRE